MPRPYAIGIYTSDIHDESDWPIPPTAVGGLLKSSLHQRQWIFLNPPDGSWGIVKVQPTVREQSHLSQPGRLNFNNPPTAVGGIQQYFSSLCRLNFNNPPTAVGGIQGTWICVDSDGTSP